MTNSYLLDQARELALREAGLAVVVTHRPDGTTQASVVNAGIVDHPVTGEPVVGFVVQGGARKKLANLRVKPAATVVFRSGWDWVAIEGDADLTRARLALVQAVGFVIGSGLKVFGVTPVDEMR